MRIASFYITLFCLVHIVKCKTSARMISDHGFGGVSTCSRRGRGSLGDTPAASATSSRLRSRPGICKHASKPTDQTIQCHKIMCRRKEVKLSCKCKTDTSYEPRQPPILNKRLLRGVQEIPGSQPLAHGQGHLRQRWKGKIVGLTGRDDDSCCGSNGACFFIIPIQFLV